MNLREQFEKEWKGGGKRALSMIKRFEPVKYWKLYAEWLQQRNKEQVEVLKECKKAIESIPKHDLGFTYTGGGNRVDDPPEGYANKDALIYAIEEQLKKSGES